MKRAVIWALGFLFFLIVLTFVFDTSLRSIFSVFDLSAADHRESDPKYSIRHEGFTRGISVLEIAPGTLMVIRFSGSSVSRNLRQKLNNLHVEVQHDGLTVNADPRGTAVARTLTLMQSSRFHVVEVKTIFKKRTRFIGFVRMQHKG